MNFAVIGDIHAKRMAEKIFTKKRVEFIKNIQKHNYLDTLGLIYLATLISKIKYVYLVQVHCGNFPKVLDLLDMELSRTQEPSKKKKIIQIFKL